MTAGFSPAAPLTAAFPTTDNFPKRDACLFSAERVLECGSIINERGGKILYKTILLPKP